MPPVDTSPRPIRARRHPSAGNLGARPVLLRRSSIAPALNPASFPHGVDQPTDRVELGPDLSHDGFQRLLGNLSGRRVLELGCATGAAAVAMAHGGAKVITVDPSHDRLTRARHTAEQHGVRVELHQGDLADLAFVRADTIDTCVAIYSLAEVQDLSRVFRQVHRVLRHNGVLLLTLPHPFALSTTPGDSSLVVGPSYPPAPIDWEHAGRNHQSHVYGIGDVFSALTSANFRVDTLVEAGADPHEPAGPHAHPARGRLPETLIFRGRKIGR